MSRKILDDMRDVMRRRHYSIHTERSYCDWIKRYIQYYTNTHREEGLINAEAKIKAFLTHLAVDEEMSLPAKNRLSIHWYFYTFSCNMKVIEATLTILL